MDSDTKRRIQLTVTDILKSADIDSVTEKDIRTSAAINLNLDLSSLPHKIFIRQLIESFLLSLPNSDDDLDEHDSLNRRVDSAVSSVLKSGELFNLTIKDALSIVEEKLGADVSLLPYESVARRVIRCLCNSVEGMSMKEVEVEEVKKRMEDVVGEVLRSDEMMCSLAINDVLAVICDRIGCGMSRSRDEGCNGGVVRRFGYGDEERQQQQVEVKPVVNPVANRVICKLSNRREVAIGGSGQNTIVSMRELIWKDGKQIPSFKSISLSIEQWSVFRESIPAIEEAITKVEARLRSELERNPAHDRDDRSRPNIKPNGGALSRDVVTHKESSHHRPGSAWKRCEFAPSVGPTPRGLVPIEIIRFDGKNYPKWADRMETYLNHLQVAHVLSDTCPSAVGMMDRELGQTLSAIEKWTEDDHICRQNILNSLCDNLFGHYSDKPGTAKDLWEELKLIYLNEEHGVKVSLVRKYIEFQMVEERSVVEQVEEFHCIADSINASGMYVEQKFHVNVILSKLPSSWKPFAVQLMKEEFLPVWLLMDHLKIEENSRSKGNKNEAVLPRPDGPPFQSRKTIGPQRGPMKKPGVNSMKHDIDRERKVRFCTRCKRKGHVLEQCWFRKPEDKDSTTENDNVRSVNVVAEANLDAAVE